MRNQRRTRGLDGPYPSKEAAEAAAAEFRRQGDRRARAVRSLAGDATGPGQKWLVDVAIDVLDPPRSLASNPDPEWTWLALAGLAVGAFVLLRRKEAKAAVPPPATVQGLPNFVPGAR